MIKSSQHFFAFHISAIAFIENSVLSGMPPWFDKKLMLASGLGYSGSSVGFFFGPPLILLFSEMYGIRGMFIMLAAIWIHTLLVGIIQRPSPPSNKIIQNSTLKANKSVSLQLTDIEMTERSELQHQYDEKCDKADIDHYDINSRCLVNSIEEDNSKTRQSAKCQTYENDAATRENATYLNWLKKPRVLHTYVILFLGILGSIGKNSLYKIFGKFIESKMLCLICEIV